MIGKEKERGGKTKDQLVNKNEERKKEDGICPNRLSLVVRT